MQAVWKKGPMTHILSGCSVALTQDRKLWRHDKVLIKESTRKRNSRQETGCFQFIQMRTQKIQSANHQCRQRRRLGTEGGPRWEAFLPRLSRVKTTRSATWFSGPNKQSYSCYRGDSTMGGKLRRATQEEEPLIHETNRRLQGEG